MNKVPFIHTKTLDTEKQKLANRNESKNTENQNATDPQTIKQALTQEDKKM